MAFLLRVSKLELECWCFRQGLAKINERVRSVPDAGMPDLVIEIGQEISKAEEATAALNEQAKQRDIRRFETAMQESQEESGPSIPRFDFNTHGTIEFAPVPTKPKRCWPWAHRWTGWWTHTTFRDPVYPHPDDGRKRGVMETRRERQCRSCGKTQSYLYDCITYEASEGA